MQYFHYRNHHAVAAGSCAQHHIPSITTSAARWLQEIHGQLPLAENRRLVTHVHGPTKDPPMMEGSALSILFRCSSQSSVAARPDPLPDAMSHPLSDPQPGQALHSTGITPAAFKALAAGDPRATHQQLSKRWLQEIHGHHTSHFQIAGCRRSTGITPATSKSLVICFPGRPQVPRRLNGVILPGMCTCLVTRSFLDRGCLGGSLLTKDTCASDSDLGSARRMAAHDL
jgi:hypothetical protein